MRRGLTHDPDAEWDALPPGDLDAAGEQMEEDDPMEPSADAGSQAAACPPLPVVLDTMKNEEMKEQLRWRGLAVSGNKPELLARLTRAVKDNVAVLEALPDRAARTAAAQVAESARWQAIDSCKIQRPEYTGEDKFVPKPELGFEPSTHPFAYMDAYYPRAIRDLEVENSNRYRHYLALNYKEIYPAVRLTQPGLDPTHRVL